MTEIISYQSVYKKEILKLAAESFGRNYLPAEEFSETIKHPNVYCLIALKDGFFAGFSMLSILGINKLKNYFSPEVFEILSKFCQQNGSVCYRQHTAVKPDYRHQGIGSLLVIKGNEMVMDKVDCIFSTVWLHHENYMLRILEKEGFINIGNLKNFWFRSSLEKGYSCAVCGNPCRCGATIMMKKV